MNTKHSYTCAISYLGNLRHDLQEDVRRTNAATADDVRRFRIRQLLESSDQVTGSR